MKFALPLRLILVAFVAAFISRATGQSEQRSVQKKQEEEVHLRLIHIKRAERETDEQLLERTRRTVVEKLRAGEAFSDLAKTFSQDASRSKGGDWGWIKRTDLKQLFSDAAFELKKGEASAPIVVSEGCFILYAEDRR